MNRSLMVHGAVLGASLITAYLVWTRERSPADEDTTAILGFRKVDRVVFDGEDKKIKVERRRDNQGSYAWVRVETKAKARRAIPKPPTVPKTSTAAPESPKPEATTLKPTVATPKPTVATPKPTVATPKPTAATPKPTASPGPASLSQDPKADPAKTAPLPGAPQPGLRGKSAAPAGNLPPAPPAKPTVAKPHERVKAFVGKKSAEELLDTMARLPAVRSLGKLSKEKLDEFELTNSKTTLTVVSGATERRFRVGARSYGNLDYYLQDMADQRVYVVDQKTIEQIKHAEFRLFNPDLHDFKLKDVDRVVISSQGKRKVLRQHDRNRPKTAYWTDEGSTEKKDSYRNWLTQLERLRVVKYTLADDPPQGVQERALVEFFDGSTRKGFVRLLEKPTLAPNATNAAPKGASDYYLVSESTRVPVEAYKARVQETVKGLADLFKD